MPIFDQIAASYDLWYQTKIGEFADKTETDCAFSLFQIKSGMHILDIGCGTGNFSLKLAQNGAQVTAIDISNEMLKIARQKAAENNLSIDFKNMHSLELQFPDNTFDGVFSMATIEFISNNDVKKMLSEMFRVCKKGGPVLVGTINRESSWGKLYQNKNFQEKVPIFKNAFLKTPAEISQFEKDSLIAVKECLFLPPDISEEGISQEKDEQLAKINQGGYFCILWQKK